MKKLLFIILVICSGCSSRKYSTEYVIDQPTGNPIVVIEFGPVARDPLMTNHEGKWQVVFEQSK